MEDVYRENPEIVKKVEWSATLEPGFKQTGRGTCLRCAGLDGRKYPVDDHPECPLHIRCRCVLLPVTVSFRELGLDIDEIKQAYRPYTILPNKNIDADGRRTILESGFHEGDYASWFDKQDRGFKLKAIGPRRFEMYEAGVIRFSDLVDRSGDLRSLKELMQ